MTNPWLSPDVARQQRELVDKQLQEWQPVIDCPERHVWPPEPATHFDALVNAVRATNYPGTILEVGCGVGHNREVLDRAGVEYRSYAGVDISPAMVALAKERYPESVWVASGFPPHDEPAYARKVADIVIDGSCLLHVDDWRAHLKALASASRRWLILHRVPINSDHTHRKSTHGYGHEFPAWSFSEDDLDAHLRTHGFEQVSSRPADGDSVTITYARPRVWVTYCDANYWPRARAMIRSLRKHGSPVQVALLWWGDGVPEYVASELATNYHVQDITGFLEAHPELRADKLPGPPRTRVEHMWTVGPQFCADLMRETGGPVTYVDADVFFHSSPEPVFAEIGDAPAGIVPHGFARKAQGLPGPTLETHSAFGTYNVGVVHLSSPAIAEDWAQSCHEWCYDRLAQGPEGWVYGDQGYLDIWPELFHAHVVKHPGACAGPWQVHTRSLDVRDGVIHFGNKPLVSYHYSGLQLLPHGVDVLTRPEYQLSDRQAEILYRPYLAALKEGK